MPPRSKAIGLSKRPMRYRARRIRDRKTLLREARAGAIARSFRARARSPSMIIVARHAYGVVKRIKGVKKIDKRLVSGHQMGMGLI